MRDKVVLITGASRGIGEACSRAFGSRGARLSLASRTLTSYPDACATQVDLTNGADRELLVGRTLDRFGRIDILVNNAGAGLYGSTEAATEENARALFELNFFAVLSLTQLVLPHMRAQASGVIVNVSSVAAEISLPWMTLYSASKAALSALSSGLRRELAGSGITVTNVLPGYVQTGFHQAATGQPPAGVARMRRRAISPARCAEAIARGVERGARTVVTPGFGWLAVAVSRTAPALLDSPLRKMNR